MKTLKVAWQQLTGKRQYKAGTYYKFYSALHLQLWQSAGVAI